MVASEIERRVRRGVSLLDRQIPNWRQRIDLSKLPTDDVLTQVFNSYLVGLHELRVVLRSGLDVETYGFVAYDPEEVELQQAAWAKIISDPQHRRSFTQ